MAHASNKNRIEYILELDLGYSKNTHDSPNNLPDASENLLLIKAKS